MGGGNVWYSSAPRETVVRRYKWKPLPRITRRIKVATAENAPRPRPVVILDIDDTLVSTAIFDGTVSTSVTWVPRLWGDDGVYEHEVRASVDDQGRNARFFDWRKDPAGARNGGYDGVIVGRGFGAFVRRGVVDAIAELHRHFTLAIFSMGTRNYIESVVTALDPTGTVFGGRVMTRENAPEAHKFVPPEWCDPGSAVVIDDSAGAWPEEVTVMVVRRIMPPSAESRTDATFPMLVDHLTTSLESYLEQRRDTATKALTFAECCGFCLRNCGWFVPSHGRFTEREFVDSPRPGDAEEYVILIDGSDDDPWNLTVESASVVLSERRCASKYFPLVVS